MDNKNIWPHWRWWLGMRESDTELPFWIHTTRVCLWIGIFLFANWFYDQAQLEDGLIHDLWRGGIAVIRIGAGFLLLCEIGLGLYFTYKIFKWLIAPKDWSKYSPAFKRGAIWGLLVGVVVYALDGNHDLQIASISAGIFFVVGTIMKALEM